MEIREIEQEDANGIEELALQVYDESPISTTFNHRPSHDEMVRLFAEKIEGKGEKSTIDFVAVEDGKVVADCEIVRTGNSEGIVGIIVAREKRGRGLGKRLLETCEAVARHASITRALAEISKENPGAKMFFSKCGYGEERDKTHGRGNTLFMSKSLLP